jgi:hypothetical protein
VFWIHPSVKINPDYTVSVSEGIAENEGAPFNFLMGGEYCCLRGRSGGRGWGEFADAAGWQLSTARCNDCFYFVFLLSPKTLAMKYICASIFFLFTTLVCDAQENEWAWIKGDSMNLSPPVFGERGIPAPENTPSGAYNSIGWVDSNGMFWSFGGSGYYGWRGDLWRFNSETLEWTWMKGSQEESDPGSFGEMGVPAESNAPPARGFGVANWTDNDGNLWLYGGLSSYQGVGIHIYADLWKYDVETNLWTWMNGSQSSHVEPNYGMPGVPSAEAHPGSRSELGATWVDQEGDLWLFGGGAEGFGTAYILYNDLWKYDIDLNQWAYMKGQTYGGAPSVYGTQGTPDEFNEPSGRMAYGSWVDSDGNFWMMGGHIQQSGSFTYNDLWRYTPGTNEWTWMKGSMEAGSEGSFGTQSIASTLNNPPARFENRANWIEDDKLYMFGGYYHIQSGLNRMLNDLWMYDISSNTWTWLSGDSLETPPAPVHGDFGIPASENIPAGRMGAIAWYDNDNTAYIFAGYEYDPLLPSSAKVTNEVWKYGMDPDCCPLNTESTQNLARFEAYPNPAATFINIRLSTNEKLNLRLAISNMIGEVVHESKLGLVSDHLRIEIPAHLSNGMYLFTLYSENNQFSQKVSVLRD